MTKPVDRVQLLKQESVGGGGDPSDAHPVFAESKLDPNEDGIEVQGVFLQIPSETEVLDEECYVTRDDSGNMLLKDENADSGNEVTLSQLLESAAGGITETEHRSLDQLVHEIAESSYDEIVYSGNTITGLITWETSSKLKKIREITVTYTGNKVTNIKTEQFDASGNVITGETMDESPAYSCSKITNVTRSSS